MVLKKTVPVLIVLDMKYNIFSTFTLVLGRFFPDPDFSRIGSGFLTDLDPDSEKSLIRTREKKPGSETLEYGITLRNTGFSRILEKLH